jgi:hypothetical protein
MDVHRSTLAPGATIARHGQDAQVRPSGKVNAEPCTRSAQRATSIGNHAAPAGIVALQPDASVAPFTMTREPGAYAVEWFNVTSRETRTANQATAPGAGGPVQFSPPSAASGPMVLSWRQIAE